MVILERALVCINLRVKVIMSGNLHNIISAVHVEHWKFWEKKLNLKDATACQTFDCAHQKWEIIGET